MPIVSIPDKNLELEFPDDMPHEQITSIIQQQIYGKQATPAQPAPAAPSIPESENALMDAGIPFMPSNVFGDVKQFATENLPTIAGMATSLSKAPLGVIAPITGLATATGGLLKKAFTSTGENEPPPAEWQGALESAGIPYAPPGTLQDFLAGVAGTFADRGLNKLASNTAEGAALAGKDLYSKAVEMGLPRFAFSKPREWLMDILEMTPGGSIASNQMKNRLNNWFLGEKKAIVDAIDAVPRSKADVGEQIGEKLLGLAKGVDYDAFGQVEAKIPISDTTRKFIHERIKYQSPSDAQALQKILDSETMTPKELNAVLGGAGKGGSGVANRELKEGLKKELYSDIDLFDKAADTTLLQTRQAADAAYSAWMNGLASNPAYVRTVRMYNPSVTIKGVKKQMYGGNPERVVDQMWNTGRAEDLEMLQNAMGPDLFNMSLAKRMESLFDKATDETRTLINPYAWRNIWEQQRRVIAKVAPDVAKRTDDFTDLLMGAAESLPKKSQNFMQSLLNWKTSLGAGGTGAALATGHIGIPLAVLGNAGTWGLSWAVAGPRKVSLSAIKNGILSTGIPQAGAKIGTINLMERDNDFQ